MTLTRSQYQAISQLHPNKEIASALHSILPLLAQHQLQWHDFGRYPDCQFTSFIHASQESDPNLDKIMEVRRAVRNWLYAHRPSFVESESTWINQNKAFGFATEQRKQGNEHSLYALASCFSTRINLITVSNSGNHTQVYVPIDNIQHKKEIWLLYINFEHTRHYLSTTKIQNLAPTSHPPPPTMRGANGTSASTRRPTVSTEPIDNPALVVGPSSRTAIQVPARPSSTASQGTPHNTQPISISEDLFANIHYVEGDFVHCLIQHGALNFIQQIYKDGTLWTPRDCRIQRTPPSEESYKEFTKCLTLILTVAHRYPVKTLQRELLTYVAKQLPFFIFPPNRCRHKKQNLLIKKAKKFQMGKWEELWKQSISEFEVEKNHMRPQQELSTAHKVRKAEYFHQHGEISRAAKVFTNESKPTNDPAHSEPLQQLFPEPREDYDSPPKMGDDSPQHWPSEQEINALWETDQASDRILKHHSIPALTKYIRARSLLSAPDIDGWRMKKLLQRIFLSSDPDNEDLKVLVYDCLYLPWLKGQF